MKKMAVHNELGKKGEELAVDFLKKEGFVIIERNFRWNRIEIDIIALKENILCAIEVKTRSTDYFGNPEDFVDYKKQKRYVWATHAYIEKNHREEEVRFDIISVLYSNTGVKIRHIPQAFSAILSTLYFLLNGVA